METRATQLLNILVDQRSGRTMVHVSKGVEGQ
jgi:hypothetical protein